MKLNLLNTAHGLVPMYDEDFDEKKRLRVGQVYKADITVPRNILFHRKAFALLNAAWSLMGESQQAAWRSKDGFRAYLTVAAGHYDIYFNPRLSQFVEVPRSWGFDSMGDDEFAELYERMKDVIYAVLGERVTEEVFEKVLANF